MPTEGKTYTPCFATLHNGIEQEAYVIWWSRRPDGWWANVTWTVDGWATHGECVPASRLRPRVNLRKLFRLTPPS